MYKISRKTSNCDKGVVGGKLIGAEATSVFQKNFWAKAGPEWTCINSSETRSQAVARMADHSAHCLTADYLIIKRLLLNSISSCFWDIAL